MLLDCGHEPSPHEDFTTGYGIDKDDKKHCWACCAARECAAMIETGKAMLYLTMDKGRKWHVTDWPGHLVFKVSSYRKGRHNIASTRIDVWFRGPDGHTWHGVQYGENTEIVHCRRTREKA